MFLFFPNILELFRYFPHSLLKDLLAAETYAFYINYSLMLIQRYIDGPLLKTYAYYDYQEFLFK